MKLYTGKGDKGETGILGRDRIAKDHGRIEAYGTIDELNATLGMVAHEIDDELLPHLQTIQSLLFEIGSELASVKPRNNLTPEDIQALETLIDEATEQTPKLTSFILPGGSLGSSWLHIARTVSRRAERRIVSLSKEIEINEYIIPYINRLSDLFFAWARLQNHKEDIHDIKWEARS